MAKAAPALFEDQQFRDQLIRMLCRDGESLSVLAPLLTEKDFKEIKGFDWGKQENLVAERALEYFGKHKEPIGELLRSEVMAYMRGLQLEGHRIERMEEYIKRLDAVRPCAPSTVIEKIAAWKGHIQKLAGIDEQIELQAAGKLTDEKLLEITRRMLLGENRVAEPESATDLIATDLPATAYALNNKLSKGLGALCAKPKNGKTWLALKLAIAFCCGLEFLGSKVRTPGPVLYCALEDSAQSIRSRLLMLGAEDQNLDHLHIVYELSGIPALRALLQRYDYKLAIIDPWLAISPTRKTQDIVRADYQELQPLRQLARELDMTILLNMHLRKAAGEMRDVVLGTMGTIAALDTIWILTRDVTSDRSARLEITGRDVEEHKLKLEFRRTTSTPLRVDWEVVAEGIEAEAGGPLQQAILALLKKKGPLQVGTIGKTLKEKDESIRVTLFKLRERKLVVKDENSKYRLA